MAYICYHLRGRKVSSGKAFAKAVGEISIRDQPGQKDHAAPRTQDFRAIVF
jgi:hypothetical protein